MTSLFGSRRRAEAFAARVDAAATGRGPGAGVADVDAELEALVDLASSLRGHGTSDVLAAPRAAFASDLRERLLTEAVTALPVREAAPAPRPEPTPEPARRSRRRQRQLAAAVTVAVMLGGSAGMATAAQGALPGEALYPVKRGIENAAVTLSGTSVGKGRELLSQASGRLHEVQRLTDGDAAQRTQIPGTLEDFHTEARKGTDLLMESYESTDNPETISSVQTFAASSMETLESIVEAAPADAGPALKDAALLMSSINTEAVHACPTCGGASDLPPDTVLSSAGGSVGEAAGLPDLGELSPPSDDHSLLGEEPTDTGEGVNPTDPQPGGATDVTPTDSPTADGGADPQPGGAASAGGEPGEGSTGGAAPTTPVPSDPAPTTEPSTDPPTEAPASQTPDPSAGDGNAQGGDSVDDAGAGTGGNAADSLGRGEADTGGGSTGDGVSGDGGSGDGTTLDAGSAGSP